MVIHWFKVIIGEQLAKEVLKTLNITVFRAYKEAYIEYLENAYVDEEGEIRAPKEYCDQLTYSHDEWKSAQETYQGWYKDYKNWFNEHPDWCEKE